MLKRGVCSCAELQVFSCYRGLKGSMSGDARNFNNIEARAVIKFFPIRQGAEGNSRHSDRHIREHAPSYASVKNWVRQFKRGDFSTYGAPCRGQPKTVTTPEIIDQIQELILEDRRISAKLIAEQLGISSERVASTIHEDLDMRKFSAKWIPKSPNADERQRCQSSEQLLEFFRLCATQMVSCRDW